MANIYREQQRALQALSKTLDKLPRSGINRDLLVMETLRSFATSERAIQRYIDTMVNAGALVDKDGTLYPPKK